MKEYYTASELKKLKNVNLFSPNKRERSLVPVQERAKKYAQKVGGQIYTGIHRSTDWSGKVAYWDKGWRLVNRTGAYAVIAPK